MPKILLITVGGSHQPVVTSVQSLNPDRTIFICSNGKWGSISQVTGEGKPCEVRRGSEVLEKLPNIPTQLNLGEKFNPETDVIAVDNPDDVSSIYLKISDCLHTLKQTDLKATLLADYTGGTKSMSVALALAALDEECELHLTTASRTDLIRVTRGETVRRPENLRDQVRDLKGRDGKIQLALRNSYELLKQWPADPLGALYQTAADRLFDQLQVRNYSILAHGLRPVTAIDYEQRFQAVIIPFIEAGLKAVIGNQTRFESVQFPRQITLT